jgi:tetratricopeptide (TPR) repeat protein
MANTAAWKGLVAGCLLLAGASQALAQQVKPENLLVKEFNPKQKDVVISTPTPAEVAGCEVKMVQGSQPGSVGYLLLDANKKPLRRFMGAAKKPIETFSYYKDGVEVYREIDGNGNNKPEQFRWLNTAGMKWGLDLNEDGKIDAWRMISAEEVGQEAFQALATHDFDRLKALFLSETEMAALKLPAAQVKRLTDLQRQAAQKFEDVCKNTPQIARANFVRVEGAPPGCALAEHFGGESDLIKYASRSILFESEVADKDGKKEKKHEWLSTGEMIQVGLAWRLIDVPSPEDMPGSGPNTQPAGNPELTKLLDNLTDIDNKMKDQTGQSFVSLMRSRINKVQEILPKVKAEEQETWYKQLFDNYAALAQNNDATAMTQLAELRKQIAAKMPGSSLAAYGSYREMWTQYAQAIGSGSKSAQDITKIQDQWVNNLESFVKSYPNAEDTTPEALHQLAIVTEFAGKEEEAKRWYRQIYTSFEKHILAEKARGGERRLNLVGKDMELQGSQLGGGDFSLGTLKGKVVVVYYWASYVDQCDGDFARLKKTAARSNFELVCVSLDDNAEAAQRYLKTNPVPGVHLFSTAARGDSGLSSPLAVQYGINGLPTMFLVGRDGKVISNRLQIGELESELRKVQ